MAFAGVNTGGGSVEGDGAAGTGVVRVLVQLEKRLTGLVRQAAAGVLAHQRIEQPLGRLPVSLFPEAIGGEDRQVGSLPERIVTVAAGRIPTDDLLVEPDEPSNVLHRRVVGFVADGAFLIERTGIERARGVGGVRRRHRCDQKGEGEGGQESLSHK